MGLRQTRRPTCRPGWCASRFPRCTDQPWLPTEPVRPPDTYPDWCRSCGNTWQSGDAYTDPAQGYRHRVDLPGSRTGDRALLRAIHFIGENDRVVDQVQALESNDFPLFLKLVSESGNSSYKRLQNIYTVKDEREQGVALALALTENYLRDINAGACRVHGGGFAGTIQIFLPANAVNGHPKGSSS